MSLATASKKTLALTTPQLAQALQNRLARKGQILGHQEAIELAESLKQRAAWIDSQIQALDKEDTVPCPVRGK
jgi:hypothetical protein